MLSLINHIIKYSEEENSVFLSYVNSILLRFPFLCIKNIMSWIKLIAIDILETGRPLGLKKAQQEGGWKFGWILVAKVPMAVGIALLFYL